MNEDPNFQPVNPRVCAGLYPDTHGAWAYIGTAPWEENNQPTPNEGEW
jgi:hypothetical protein